MLRPLSLALLLFALTPQPDAVEGLWSYVSIGRPGAAEVPIAGLFLFREGRFVQQSLNAGEPFDRQLAQAHFGTYRVEGGELHLVAEVGLVVNPTREPPLESRRMSEHRVRAERVANSLTLTFGTGTVQRLTRVGPSDGQVILVEHGALALVDNHFLLVAETPGSAVAGSGRFTRRQDALSLMGDRWFQARDGRVTYDRSRTIQTTVSRNHLELSNGFTLQRAGRATEPPLAPGAPIVVRNVTLIDGTGAPARRGTSLLLENGTVTAVGPRVRPPAGSQVIDGAGKFAIPGLIDTHVHLDAPMVFQLTPEERAEILGHNARAFLYNGVTTVLNLSSDAEWIWKQRADQRAGRLLAPRIYAMGRSFTPEGGWGSRHGGALTSVEAVRAQAREYVANGTDGFKVMIEDGLGGSGTYTVMPDAMLEALAEEAAASRVPLYVHAINLVEYRKALSLNPRAIVHGLEDPIPEGDPLLEQIRSKGTFVVPTISLFDAFTSFDGHPERFDDPILQASVPAFLLANMRRPQFMAVERTRFREVARMDVYPWARRAIPTFCANTRKMRAAGITLAVGTDAGGPVGYNFQGYNTPREVELLVECGLSPMEALVAATRTGAEMIGIQQQLGTLEPGKMADLLILSADPLADIRNIRRIETVIQGGIAYPRDTFAYRRGVSSAAVR